LRGHPGHLGYGPIVAVDLPGLVGRLADRRPGRTEANVQSDLHLLLTAAPLDLGDQDLVMPLTENYWIVLRSGKYGGYLVERVQY
jgi:hypothetical protein